MSVKFIIFDLDGTLADTLTTIVTITNHLAAEFGYPQATPEDIQALQNLSSREVIKTAGVSAFKLPFLLRKVKKSLNAQMPHIKSFSGIHSTLSKLKQQGYHLGIISSNSKENILSFLQNNQLDQLFDFIYSGTTIFGKAKVLQKLMQEKKLQNHELIYVGDETRDIDAAKKTGIKIVSVGWGFNSPKILAHHQPNFLIFAPQELLNVMEKLRQQSSGTSDRN